MRKNDVRKWIHAGLDLLPLLIIPIFGLAVRSDNNFQPIEVEVQEKINVDFNQLAINGLKDRTINVGNLSLYFNDNSSITFDGTYSGSSVSYNGFSDDITFKVNHKYLYKRNISSETYRNVIAYLNTPYISLYSGDDIFFTFNYSTDVTQKLWTWIDPNTTFTNLTYTYQLFDLTQIYGVGNEPSNIDEFNAFFPNSYYHYTLSKNMLVDKPSFTTYNDTDVGSQMLYTLYNSCDKYFNLNNVFNFNQIYDWLELNIFNGTAPMSIYIAWNVFLYEFLMDLIFLLYALFMFFVDFCSNLIDRFHTKCSGGK